MLGQQNIDAARVTMIGDRKYDVVAAKSHNIPTIGVTYGFGTRSELEESGVIALCDSANDIPELLLNETAGSGAAPTAKNRTI